MKKASKLRGKVYKSVQVFSLVVLVFNMSFMGVFFVADEASAADWPSCGFQCQANDTTGVELKLVNDNGEPILTCEPGTSQSAKIVAVVNNSSGSDRVAAVLLGDIYQGNDLLVHLKTNEVDGICSKEVLEKQSAVTLDIYSLDWTCGETLRIENLVLSWTTGNATCDDFFDKPACKNRTTKCFKHSNGIEVLTPLVANFDFSPACDGDIVNFSGIATGGKAPYSYNWNFGDDSTSAEQNPSHTYAGPGDYNVVLTVTDNNSNIDDHSDSVNVFSNPTADFSATPSSGKSPLLVSFTDMSSAGDAPIDSWSWDFGDAGLLGVDQSPSYIYMFNGSYSPSLTVTDGNGCSDTEQKDDHINTAECVINDDCDNGLTCNGAETCDDNGRCQPGTATDCSSHDVIGLNGCDENPDNNPLTWDFRGVFISTCQEPTGECSQIDPSSSHNCDINQCNAECVSDSDCSDTVCLQDDCVDNDYYDYSNVSNTCSDCLCSDNQCGEPVISYNDPACTQCQSDDDCSSLNNTYCEGTTVTQDKGVCNGNYECETQTEVIEDCDNGLWCDGQENCSLGKCVSSETVDCSLNDITGVGTCGYTPDNNPFTYDFREQFNSTCDEENDICSVGNTDITNTCDTNCGGCTEDADCPDDNNPATVDTCNLQTCKCENTPSGLGSLTIVKVAIDSVTEFAFSAFDINNTSGFNENFLLKGGDDITFYELNPGTYDVFESFSQDQIGLGWYSDSISCTASTGPDGGNGILVEVGENENVTCTFSNIHHVCGDGQLDDSEACDDGNTNNGDGCDSECQSENTCEGTVTVNKYRYDNGQTTEGLADWGFTLVQADGNHFSVTGTTSPSGTYIFENVECGEYRLIETVKDGWTVIIPSTGYYANVFVEVEGLHPAFDFYNKEDTEEGPYCGDGIKNLDEECDGSDGITSGYYCTSDCELKKRSGGGNPFLINRGSSSTGQSSTPPTPTVAGEEGAPALVISKTVDQEFVNIGDEVEYIITVTNNGSLTAFEVNLEDLLPKGLEFVDDKSTTKTWDLGDIATGVSKSATVIVKVTGDITIGKITNTATAVATNHPIVEDSANVEIREIAVLAETGFSLSELILMISGLVTLLAITFGLKRRLLA